MVLKTVRKTARNMERKPHEIWCEKRHKDGAENGTEFSAENCAENGAENGEKYGAGLRFRVCSLSDQPLDPLRVISAASCFDRDSFRKIFFREQGAAAAYFMQKRPLFVGDEKLRSDPVFSQSVVDQREDFRDPDSSARGQEENIPPSVRDRLRDRPAFLQGKSS